MRISYLIALFLVVSVPAAGAPTPAKTPIQKVEERLAVLEAENKALKERIEALERRAGGQAAGADAKKDGGSVVRPAAIRIGMPISQAVEIARMNGSSMVKVRTIENADGKTEFWKESYSVEVPDLSGGTVERRFTEGYRVPTKSKQLWNRSIEVVNGKISSIEQNGSTD